MDGSASVSRSPSAPTGASDDAAPRPGLRVSRSADASEGALRLLARASAVLASSLDYETTLKSAAALVVPVLADWCAVDLASADGQPRRVAVAHVDPAKVALAEELRRRYPPVEDDARGPAAVLRSGVSELVPDIPDELLAGGAKDPTQLELLRELGLRSYMVVPLVPPTGGRPIGTVTLVAAESGRRFGRDDLELAEELAARFAAAVHNAELYRQARDAVERQQREARQKEALLRIARLLSSPTRRPSSSARRSARTSTTSPTPTAAATCCTRCPARSDRRSTTSACRARRRCSGRRSEAKGRSGSRTCSRIRATARWADRTTACRRGTCRCAATSPPR
jgi:hypothetical protein